MSQKVPNDNNGSGPDSGGKKGDPPPIKSDKGKSGSNGKINK